MGNRIANHCAIETMDNKMKFEVMVYVRLPDGSFLWLPVARNASEQKVAEFDSKAEAGNWAEFCLPDKVLIQER